MLKRIVLIAIGVVLIFSTPLLADWFEGDGHKMHFPQLPDEAGWDVAATGPQTDPPLVLADDWQCSETGPVKDIHFWGSWRHGITGDILYFVLSIHADIPADPPAIPYSRPGATLWEEQIYPDQWIERPIEAATPEGWYNPATGIVFPEDHMLYFQYNVFLPEDFWFEQVEGTIYWLNISAVVADPIGTAWGWKSSINHWNDDAVWAVWGALDWIDMYDPFEPTQSLDLAFVITGGLEEPEGACCYPDPTGVGMLCVVTTALDCGQNLMGVYQGDGTTCAGVEACCVSDGSCVMVDALCCVNELGGTPMGAGSSCSAPLACCFPDGSCANLDPICCDDMGGSPSPTGAQACLGDGNQNGVDDACEELVDEACCLEDGSCIDTDPATCLSMGGTPQGLGTFCTATQACCLANGDCVEVDPLCCDELGGTPQGSGTHCTEPEACCMDDGRCLMLDPLCCVDQNGVPQGEGTTCGTVLACCFDDGSCQAMDVLCCDDLGGWVSPIGATQCLGDQNENGIDDACEAKTEACCLPDNTCIDTDPDDCASQGGISMGSGTQCTGEEACCLQDGTCMELDPLCCVELGGTPQGVGNHCTAVEACCLADGRCVNLDPLCCLTSQGTPQGPGTSCTMPEACCMPDGTCRDLDPLCCELIGGNPSPIGAQSCLGDGNQNDVDDACEEGTTIYYKPGYPDYAPYGMPDIDQKQANWNQFGPFTYCGPVAVANCLFWFDSKFQFLINPESPPPPAINDDFRLIESGDAAYDDHDARNVVPIVDALAACMATGPAGTDIHMMHDCVLGWITALGLEDSLEVHLIEMPDWEFIREEVKRSQDVILLLGFWQPDQESPIGWSRIGGHYLTVAGVDTLATAEAPVRIFVSDPFFDYQEILDGDPPHAPEVHNDLALNSGPHYSIRHDEFLVSWPSESPGGVLWLPNYPIGTPGGWEMVLNFVGQNCPPQFMDFQADWLYDQIFVEVEYALNICPLIDENCCDIRGDFDHSGRVDVQDVVDWVNWSFGTGDPPVCEYPENFWPECDMDDSGRVDVADIVYWVNWSFHQGDDPVPCP